MSDRFDWTPDVRAPEATDMNERLEEIVAKLKQERDELRVKAHLGGLEAKEEWEQLEKKWQGLESQMAQRKERASEVAKDVGDKVQVVADELGSAYRRIRERLGDE